MKTKVAIANLNNQQARTAKKLLSESGIAAQIELSAPQGRKGGWFAFLFDLANIAAHPDLDGSMQAVQYEQAGDDLPPGKQKTVLVAKENQEQAQEILRSAGLLS